VFVDPVNKLAERHLRVSAVANPPFREMVVEFPPFDTGRDIVLFGDSPDFTAVFGG
jgi:hypothetical protein